MKNGDAEQFFMFVVHDEPDVIPVPLRIIVHV